MARELRVGSRALPRRRGVAVPRRVGRLASPLRAASHREALGGGEGHEARGRLLALDVVFSIVGTVVKVGAPPHAGVFRLYEDFHSHSWVWFLFSIAALIVLQDTYFYWTHRAMHHRWVFKHVHRAHHLSHNPSPWAA